MAGLFRFCQRPTAVSDVFDFGCVYVYVQAMLDAFLILLNVAAFVGYGTIPLDVFFPQRSLLTDWLPPGESLGAVEPNKNGPPTMSRLGAQAKWWCGSR